MTRRKIGVGLISVGWMGNLHTYAYKTLAQKYPELNVDVELIIAADTSQERAKYAQDAPLS